MSYIVSAFTSQKQTHMNLRLGFILLFFIMQAGLMTQGAVVEAIHDRHVLSYLDVKTDSDSGNELHIMQGDSWEILLITPDQDTLWIVDELDFQDYAYFSFFQLDPFFTENGKIDIFGHFFLGDYGEVGFIRLDALTGELEDVQFLQGGILDFDTKALRLLDGRFLLLSSSSYLLTSPDFEPLSTGTGWLAPGGAGISDVVFNQDETTLAVALRYCTNNCSSPLQIVSVSIAGDQITFSATTQEALVTTNETISRFVSDEERGYTYFVATNRLFSLDAEMNPLLVKTFDFQSEEQYSFFANNRFHHIRSNNEEKRVEVFAFDPDSLTLRDTSRFLGISHLAIAAATFKEQTYQLYGSRKETLYTPVSSIKNAEEAINLHLPLGATFDFDPAVVQITELSIDEISTSSGIYFPDFFSRQTNFSATNVVATIRNEGNSVLNSCYLNVLVDIFVPFGFWPVSNQKRIRYDQLALQPGEEMQLDFGDIGFQYMRDNQLICIHLSNLNEAPSESYEGKKFCFLTVSDVKEEEAGINAGARLQVYQQGPGQLNISASEEIQTLHIFDAAGRLVQLSDNYTQSLFFNHAPGIYVCLVQLRDGRQLSQRFVFH